MENAADALKMGAAILVFSIALVTAFSVFSQAREVSETVFLALDDDAYMEYMEGDKPEGEETSGSFKRIVGLETIIPTIYKYYDERYNVEIKNKSGNLIKRFDIGNSDGTYDVLGGTENIYKSVEKFVTDELLENYKNSKFEESIEEMAYSGNTYTDDDTGETIETKSFETLITITYQLI